MIDFLSFIRLCFQTQYHYVLQIWWNLNVRKRKSNTKFFTVYIISLKNQDHPFGENETNMQNLIFSFRRHWTFYLTAASLKAIGYSDALRKVVQNIVAFGSVRGFWVSYVSTEVELVIAITYIPLQSSCKHFCTVLFITSPSSGTGCDVV